MKKKKYKIYLGEHLIGFTKLEKADAPMGVAFGEIEFTSNKYGYDFFRDYCEENEILYIDFTEDFYLSTCETIEDLKIISPEGTEIKGVGNQISIIKNELNEISIQGIPSSIYEKEFPHHVKEYEEQFK
ncbi:hypothetical protein [Aureivirga sp. CE67]|uniref:hypothetical protein n=1 Tax=Aureivirga sp. CE67 TaxID=1788983 RepID=UPI0018C90249|nr:hypothetical protein [Aureivirga sp. CE67]